MGNICGKEKPDNFASPGRTVGTAPGPNATPKSSVPKKAVKVTGPGRTLGGSSSGQTASQEQTPEEARRRAAEAAEVRGFALSAPRCASSPSPSVRPGHLVLTSSPQARAAGAQKGGKLQAQLDAQKKQSRSDALKEASRQELARREADDVAQAKNWD
jgi:hypothetical protein